MGVFMRWNMKRRENCLFCDLNDNDNDDFQIFEKKEKKRILKVLSIASHFTKSLRMMK